MNRIKYALAHRNCLFYVVVIVFTNMQSTGIASVQSNQNCDGFCPLEIFDDKRNGSIRTQGNWQTNPAGSLDGAFVTDKSPAPFNGKSLQIDPAGVQFRGNAYLPLQDHVIADGSIGTLFFQIYTEDINDSYSHFGLTYLQAPRLTENNPEAAPLYTDFEVQFSLNRGHFTVKHGGDTVRLTNLIAESATLYNIWLVADNFTDSYEVYVQGGAHTEPLRGLSDELETFAFRNGEANLDLQALYSITSPDLVLHSNRYLDNIYLDSNNPNTTNPLGSTPDANSYREVARFDSLASGNLNTRDGWNGSGANVTDDPLDSTNKALQITGVANVSKLLDGVADQTEATLFFRIMRRGFVNASAGLSDTETPQEYADGRPDADDIKGSNGADSVFGAGGNDVINGGKGRDLIHGGENDTVSGGNGNDQITGGPGDDVLRGNSGADTIYGGSDNDKLIGGPSSGDVCNGQSGTDSATASCETTIDTP